MDDRHLHSLARDKRLHTWITYARALDRRCDFTATGKQGAITNGKTDDRALPCGNQSRDTSTRERRHHPLKFFHMFLEILSNIQEWWGLHPKENLLKILTKLYTLNYFFLPLLHEKKSSVAVELPPLTCIWFL